MAPRLGLVTSASSISSPSFLQICCISFGVMYLRARASGGGEGEAEGGGVAGWGEEWW